jgi:hypothetical protein
MSQKKRRLEDGMRGKTDRPKKRFRKQKEYHSSSEDSDGSEGGFAKVNLNDSDDEGALNPASGSNQTILEPRKAQKAQKQKETKAQESASESEADDPAQDEVVTDEDSEDEEAPGAKKRRPTSKRNDPEAFSTSIAKILSTKLSQSARKDPVLSRSREAADTSTSLANERLEARAKAKMKAERREDLDRGRIKDVLGLNSGQAGEIAEEEKRLRKVAQRGVIKLFNAVRAAQVKAEQAAKEERKKGTIGMSNREEKVNEMSKQGFLELIAGKKSKSTSEA